MKSQWTDNYGATTMSTRVFNPLMGEFNRLQSTFEPEQERVRVCRSLFGPVDHDESKRFLQEELSRITQQDSKRWNFDFQKDKPLEGRFAWETVDEEVHSAYECRRLPFIREHCERVVDSRVTGEELQRCTHHEGPVHQTHCDRNQNTSAIQRPVPRPASQSKITDFLRTRKRPSSTITTDGTPSKKLFSSVTSDERSRFLVMSDESPFNKFCTVTSDKSPNKRHFSPAQPGKNTTTIPFSAVTSEESSAN